MKLHSFDKVKQLTEDMVAIPSINKEPGGESAVARYMQDFYSPYPTFRRTPSRSSASRPRTTSWCGIVRWPM